MKRITQKILLLLSGLLFITGFTIGQNQLLSERIPVLKQYAGEQLYRISLPIGGIGTGTVGLGGSGELRDWQIMNVPAKNYSTVTTGNDAPFFAIYTKKQDGQKNSKALLGPIQYPNYDSYEGRAVDNHGMPRFREASFETTYPFGIVKLSDKTMPVKIKIVGYNPLIPGEADASGIPVAILQYEVENITNENVEVSIAGSMRNFIGMDGSKFWTDWKGDYVPTGAKSNKNIIRISDKVKGIYMYSDEVDKEDAAWGTISLTTPLDTKGQISYRTSSAGNAWGNALLDFWDDFSADGILTEKEKLIDDNPMASLSVKRTIAAGKKEVFTFYITWHFPNRFAWSKTNVGNYYTTKYKDAWDVINTEEKRIPSLTDQTLTFVNAIVNSSYPNVVKEAALFNISNLRSQTVFRLPTGQMMGWEGIMDRRGSCAGSCTHVWNYEQATAFLFGDLAKTMREVEFGYSTNKEGLMVFRTPLPLKKNISGKTAADGQMGTIMKFYRDWQLSGDNDFLKLYWPKVKLALSYAWIKNGWDGDQNGVMEGVQHNTMDVEYYGPNPQMQIWYLGALKSGEKMACAMKDKQFAKKCEKLYNQGSKWTDENLFNGEYYEQKIETPEERKAIAAGLTTKEFKKPDYQIGTGCLVDQLVGQYMAHIAGLGYLVDKAHVKKTLESILKYNHRESMFEHFNNMRSYAMGDEKSLLMASWPHGGRPKIPFPYWSEVMTGFEYTAAIGMLYEGMEEEGLEVIKDVRDRFDGKKRNPFDEVECGRHYSRAMASWGAIVAESNFHYSGIEQSMSFTNRPGNYFWSNGYVWGTCIFSKPQGKYNVVLKVLHGELTLKSFSLDNVKIKKYRKPLHIMKGKSVNILM